VSKPVVPHRGSKQWYSKMVHVSLVPKPVVPHRGSKQWYSKMVHVSLVPVQLRERAYLIWCRKLVQCLMYMTNSLCCLISLVMFANWYYCCTKIAVLCYCSQ